MKTFFYPAKRSDCSIPCTAGRCVCRCVEMLGRLISFGELVVLPGGSNLTCANSMMLRSGDPIILYAADLYDLDDLIEIREIFDPFKVVLIFGSDSLLSNVSYHLLKPRYLTSLQGNTQELNAVLWRMAGIQADEIQPANALEFISDN